jgi:hypothetical protein
MKQAELSLPLEQALAVLRALEQRAESLKFPLEEDDLTEYRLLERAGVALIKAIVVAEK